jgi:uncharacterized protein YsxB (DUF464 family)
MTKIKYNPAEFRIEIQGHADWGEYGKDLVCAAASMLMMTLENMVTDYAESLQPCIYKSTGEAIISCAPTKGNATKCRTIFDTIFGGYELLSMNCPEHVQAVKVKGE